MRFTKTCCAWLKKNVLYKFHGKKSVTIFRSLTLKNAIWAKRAAHDLKIAFCTNFMESDCFPVLKRICDKCNDFQKFDPQKCDFGKTWCAWSKKSVFYNFHGKRTVFSFWREFQASVTIFTTLTLTNAIWPKRAAHDLKRAFCTNFMESDCFPVLKRICDKCNDFQKFDPQKCDFGKTWCAWSKKSVFYNFHGKRTVFSFWREFQASVTIFTTLTLTNAIWPKRGAHYLKRAFCTIFNESALFSRFEENFRPVWRFWQLWRSKMRFGQKVLRMTWKEGFVQFLWKAHCFPLLERIGASVTILTTLTHTNAIFAKTCCAWPEKSVLYNFHRKRTVLKFWPEL